MEDLGIANVIWSRARQKQSPRAFTTFMNFLQNGETIFTPVVKLRLTDLSGNVSHPSAANIAISWHAVCIC